MTYLSEFMDINGLPFATTLVVSGVLVYLGLHVVERKVIFVDLALAQIAAFGVMWAILMGYNHEEDTVAVTLYSLAFTIVGAIIFSITRSRNKRVPHEALIGIVYVTATAAGLVLADRFALGTEALKELTAGRVALVTKDTFLTVLLTCAAVGGFHLGLRRKFLTISTDPAKAATEGINLHLWDFLFYLSFGVLITQVVTVLGVLPVFAYLVIPAVAGALLFETVWARLIFGWGFAAVGSLIGLEVARHRGLDPGPTIVCLFAAALVVVGVFLFVRARGLRRRAVLQAVGFTAFFALFLAGTTMFRKPVATDELAAALSNVETGEAAKLRQAMVSFAKFPDDRSRWLPLVVNMVNHSDHVVREDAVSLLGKVGDRSALPALVARLDGDTEEDDAVREKVVKAIRALDDPSAVKPLVAAAGDEIEADIAVEMCEAAFELGGASDLEAMRQAADILVALIVSDDIPRGARRDAEEHLRSHVVDPPATSEELASWWQENRARASWEPDEKRLGVPD